MVVSVYWSYQKCGTLLAPHFALSRELSGRTGKKEKKREGELRKKKRRQFGFFFLGNPVLL